MSYVEEAWSSLFCSHKQKCNLINKINLRISIRVKRIKNHAEYNPFFFLFSNTTNIADFLKIMMSVEHKGVLRDLYSFEIYLAKLYKSGKFYHYGICNGLD